jgi:hypothetical protein
MPILCAPRTQPSLPLRTPICITDGKVYIPGWVGTERAMRLEKSLRGGEAEIVHAHDATGHDLGLYIVMKDGQHDGGS